MTDDGNEGGVGVGSIPPQFARRARPMNQGKVWVPADGEREHRQQVNIGGGGGALSMSQ